MLRERIVTQGENLATVCAPPSGPVAPVTACVVTRLAFLAVHLIPVSVAKNGGSSKSRKRIMPDPVTEPPGADPVYEALLYCNLPSVAERSMEGRPACTAQLGTWTDTPLGAGSSSGCTAQW